MARSPRTVRTVRDLLQSLQPLEQGGGAMLSLQKNNDLGGEASSQLAQFSGVRLQAQV